MTTAVFVTVASPEGGGGHVVRCLALAESLARNNVRPVFAVNRITLETVGQLRTSGFEIVAAPPDDGPSPALRRDAGVVVFDSYRIDRTIERQWRSASCLRVAIDDLANRHHDCELLIDHRPGRRAADYAALVPEGCEVLAGPSFALLRDDFRHFRERALVRRTGQPPRRLLVSLGLTDVGGVTRQIVDGALRAGLGLEIDVVVGSGAASLGWLRSAAGAALRVHVDIDAIAMAELMVAADIAIGAGGGSSLERCCMGLPTLMVLVADNQRTTAANLEKMGAVRILGDLAIMTPEHVAAGLKAFSGEAAALQQCARAAASVVDGLGADRVCQAILGKTA